MGGEVFVGMRWMEKGRYHEHCSLRWTNEMPWYMSQPSFYSRAPCMEAFVADTKESNRWPAPKLVHEIQPSEYGVILFDYIHKIVFSRQNYNTPGHLCVHPSDDNDMDTLRALHKSGALVKVEDGMSDRTPEQPFVVLTAQQIETVLASTGGYTNTSGYKLLFAHYEIPGWTFDNEIVKGCDVWQKVRQFVKEHAWQSRVWSMERVAIEGRLALMGAGVLKTKRK